MTIERYEDPGDPLNSARYHTPGKQCIERGCTRQAGTAWSPHWCQPCNAARMKRIGNSFAQMQSEMNKRSKP
jgi:hypothetical protein